MTLTLRAEVLEETAQAESIQIAWDALAKESGKPFCAPGWMLAWWRNARPDRSRLRIVTVLEGQDLVGIAPLFSRRAHTGLQELRFLGSRTSVRAEPLARTGREREVAEAIASSLDSARPRGHVLFFEGVPTLSRWPELLCNAWASRTTIPYKHRAYPTLAPTLNLRGRTYDEWFASRSSHFRQEARRRRRHLEERGAEFRLADGPEETVDALGAFFRLHHSRWQQRGGSSVLTERVQAMLLDAALSLYEEQRFRIWTITIGGDIISAHIFVAAGGEVAYWLGGFDQEWAKFGPAIQSVLKALEHAWSLGDTRMDFGAGAQEYKYSFAEDQDVLESVMIAPRSPRYLVTRTQLLPRRMREAVSARLSPELREKLGRLRRRP